MLFSIPYGSTPLNVSLDWGRCLGILDIADVPELEGLESSNGGRDGARPSIIHRAIEHPIGLGENIYQMVRPGETVALVVSDSFRQTCAHQFLPVLADGLNRAGIPDDRMIAVYATGSHRGPTRDEEAKILGPGLLQRFSGRTFSHDPRDESQLTYFGTTSRGTPLKLNKRVFDCDRVIVTGAVVLHYFGGYGGGRKAVLPGLASMETISHNHAMNLDPHSDRLNPEVRIGAMDGNPVSEDMLEGSRMAKVDYLINTVLNRHGQIAGIFAGDLDAAHRAAAELARRLFAVKIAEQADLVIASSGGTRNYVQTHKALFNAYQAVKPGGRIILLAKCPEGLGGEQFVKWLRLGDRSAIIAGLRKQSEINGQTALSTIGKAPITLFVTELSDTDVSLLRGRKAPTIADALVLARQELQRAGTPDPSYYVMPSAAYTVPFL